MSNSLSEFLLMIASLLLLLSVIFYVTRDETAKVEISVFTVEMTDAQREISVERCKSFVDDAVMKGLLKPGEVNCE